jgi:hypothetical protein
MATEKHLWLKEIAFHFGMSTKEFAETISYSRQMLYCASSGSCKLNQGHLGLAVCKLLNLSDRILEGDIQSAKDRHALRRKMIDDFAKRFTVEGK